jgi:type I restriction enzyme, S subunit
MQTDCFPESINDWPKKPIGELAEVNPRYRLKKGPLYPFVEMAAVGENFAGIQAFEQRKLEGSGLSRFKVGDTLFAKITPCPENGKVAYVATLPDEVGLGSTEFIVLSPRSGTDPRFLFHLACSHAVRGRAVSRMEGSTGCQRVPDEVFTKRLLVPVPKPPEQVAIARILDALNTVLDRTRSAIDGARGIKRALVQNLFSEGLRGERQKKTAIGLIPSSWEVVPVKSVIETFQYGLSVPMEQKGRIPILRMGNIQDGEIVLGDLKEFGDLKYVNLPDKVVEPYIVQRGDILFNRTNSQEWVGKVGIYRHDTSTIFASYLIRLLPDTTRVNSYYVGHVLAYSRVWQDAHDGFRGSEAATPSGTQQSHSADRSGSARLENATVR